jgi:hypothetical protein
MLYCKIQGDEFAVRDRLAGGFTLNQNKHLTGI